MSSPAKRRKKNDHQSGASGKNLDFFFAKQKDTNLASVPGLSAAPADATTAAATISQPGSGFGTADAESVLTDEEVAKRLHEELNGVNLQSSSQVPTETEDENKRCEYQGLREASPNIDATSENARVESSDSVAHYDIGQISSGKATKETLSLQSTAKEQDKQSSNVPFDENCLTFDPQDYIPQLQLDWAAQDGSATYALLTQCFILVSSTQSRIKIVNILVNFVRTLIEGDPDSLLPAVRALFISVDSGC